MKIRYLQTIIPIADKALYKNMARRMSDSASHDFGEYTDVFRLTTDGSHLIEDHPCGDNMQAVAQTWVNPSVPASSGMFDGFRMVRGNIPIMTDEDIQYARDNWIIGIEGVISETLAEHGLTEDTTPPSYD